MQPGKDRQWVTAALLLGSFLSAVEATAVAAAVPTAVGEMGGVSRYSWVFSAYLLTSTTTVPMYGKLADLFGRRPVYHAAVALFLLGSALSGFATSLEQLILFRALQGLGAGGVMPVASTLVGDIYSLEERGRIQALFSGIWAASGLLGPLVGGLITDALSWRWIFFLNIPFGILSSVILQRSLQEETVRRAHRLDVLGTVSLTAGVTFLLIALTEGPEAWGWSDPRTLAFLAGSVLSLVVFFWQELRAPEPMLPLHIFRNRVISVSGMGNAIIGVMLFAVTAYVPVFAQGVLGGTAVDAGTILAPILIGWPISSVLAGRWLLRMSYRRMALGGSVLITVGTLILARSDADTTRTGVMVALFIIGFGLGFLSMPYMISVQNAVPWGLRGVATGTVQFFRTMGGAIGVAALGALFNSRLHASGGAGLDANSALDPALRAKLSPDALGQLTTALLSGLQGVFVVLFCIAVVAIGVAVIFPRGSAQSLAMREERPEAAS
ncbi:MAG TPA: DHA2 family efflux MFS transporter permease subunit [Thermoanaerobaculia bacterium]|nr:DHA2 family efflux MFS transporter permease subunit [Thermoanaerobaculia bacterium]